VFFQRGSGLPGEPMPAVINFRVGEKVVYPTHGVGIIEQIHCWPGGSPQKFYLLRIYANSLRVMVPFTNAASVGLRRIVKTREISRILEYLADGLCCPAADWKCRYKENSEKMRTGSIVHVAEVFKNLVYLSRVKPLSFREKRMLDRARFLLISELSTVMNQAELEIEDRIEKAVNKGCGKVPVA
jgi:CarD family transcriptional regulator